ncbi:MAG: hypothetical protein P8Y34_11760 [Anaerolineales bacterium]
MNDSKIRIVIVDDHIVVRRGIRALLDTEQDLEILAEGENGTPAKYWRRFFIQRENP